MTCIKTITSETGGTDAVSVLKMIGDRHLLIGNMNGQLGIYDFQAKIEKSYTGHKNQQHCLDFSVQTFNGRPTIVGSSEDGYVCVWDLQSQYLIAKKPIFDGATCLSLDYHEDLGNCVVSSGK